MNGTVPPTLIVALVGERLIEDKDAVLTVRVVDPFTAPKAAVIVVVPPAAPVAVAPLMVATEVSEEDHVASVDMFSVLPSLKLPVAVNGRVPPTAMVGLVGVTTIETRVASVTFRLVEVVMDPKAAVIVAEPTECALAKPLEFTVTILLDKEPQVTWLVRFLVLPLL